MIMNNSILLVTDKQTLKDLIIEAINETKASQKKVSDEFDSEKMTVSQGALYIQTSYQTLCKWINEGRIPVHGIGRKRFLLRSEFIEHYKNLR